MRDKTPNLTDYEKTYYEFKWEVPEYYNFGFDGIDRWAEDRTKLALISVDDTGIHAIRHTFYVGRKEERSSHIHLTKKIEI